MGRWKRETVMGVILVADDEDEGRVLCSDCFEAEKKKHKIHEIITQEVIESGDLFTCDECDQEI